MYLFQAESIRIEEKIKNDSIRTGDTASNKKPAQQSALTVLGKAQPVEASERSRYHDLYLSRHPYLDNFLKAPSTAFIKILVYHYLLVSRFQNVMEYNIRDEIDLFT